jgi:hypothetical protein
MLPEHVTQLFHTCENSGYVLRSSSLKLSQPKPKTNFLKNMSSVLEQHPNRLVENPKRVNKFKICPSSTKQSHLVKK